MQADDLSVYYVATYPHVRAYLYRLVRDAQIASELAQEAFVRLIAAGRDVLPADERTSYVFTIATNLARDHGKRARRERETNVAETVDAPVPGRALELERALASLPDRQRAIIWLAYAEGFDHRAIARAVGVAEKSVKVLLFRAKKKLMEVLR